ncbi:MAG: hypothetical protein AAF941_05930 [Pseudomonadota bacterium]
MIRWLPSAFIFTLGVHASAISGQTDTADVCGLIVSQDWFEDGWSCSTEGRGLAVSAPHESLILAQALDQAVLNFERFFGPTSAKVAVIGTPSLSEAVRASMRDEGYLLLPWINQSAKQDLLRRSIERQVMEQTQSLAEPQRQALLAKALSKIDDDARSSSTPPSDIELGTLAHEAGHILFADSYDDGEAPADGERRYGSSSPDWLDELAAVLNENGSLTSSRYDVARERLRAGDRPTAFSLREYLTMEHPSLRAAQLLRERRNASGDSVAIALSGEEAKRFLEESGGDPVQFYVQSRLFADFMFEKTENPRIFVEIAETLGAGQDFETWLAANGSEHGLAEDIDTLGNQFSDWVTEEFKTP